MIPEPTMVDRTTVDELTGKLVLVIDEERAWRNPDLMHGQLAAKVKKYVRYIRSPEFRAEHDKRPQSTIIRLVSAEPPGDPSLRFFERVSYELSKHGIAFEQQVGEDGIPVTIAPVATPTDRDVRRQRERAASPAPPVPDAPPPKRHDAGPTTPPSPPPSPSEAEAPGAVESETPAPSSPTAPEQAPSREAEAPAREEGPPEGEVDTPPEVAAEQVPVEPEAPELETPAPRQPTDETETIQAAEFSPDEIIERARRRKKEAPSQPAFFPEEEFGRSLPDLDEVETVLQTEPEPAVIETSSGQRYALDTEAPQSRTRKPKRKRATEERTGFGRAVLAALVGAMAGAVIWGLLAIPAASGASPLALAVAIMVGFNVRLRGGGHTIVYRLVGVIGTLLGSLLGALLAAAALTATGVGLPEEIGTEQPVGLSGVLSVLSDPNTAIAAITRYYQPLDLIAVVIALYVAFRLSASKPSS